LSTTLSQVAVVAVLTLLPFAFDAGPAQAHDVLVTTQPANGATIASAPPQVELTFDKPVQFGGGFYRAHRSVFAVLQGLKHQEDGRIEVDRDAWLHFRNQIAPEPPDSDFVAALDRLESSITRHEGTPRLWQATHAGRVFYDYYPSGPLTAQHIPSGQWRGEDHGFWMLCQLAGLIPRIETRTRLIHIGRKGYPYLGPDEGGGQ